MEKFADRLKGVRLEKGLTLEELAKEVNISTSSLSRWELSQADIKGYYLVILAKYFNVTTDYLLGIED